MLITDRVPISDDAGVLYIARGNVGDWAKGLASGFYKAVSSSVNVNSFLEGTNNSSLLFLHLTWIPASPVRVEIRNILERSLRIIQPIMNNFQ